MKAANLLVLKGLQRGLGYGLILVGLSVPVFAGNPVVAVPEIDAGSAVGALTLLSGAYLMITGRVRRKRTETNL